MGVQERCFLQSGETWSSLNTNANNIIKRWSDDTGELIEEVYTVSGMNREAKMSQEMYLNCGPCNKEKSEARKGLIGRGK